MLEHFYAPGRGRPALVKKGVLAAVILLALTSRAGAALLYNIETLNKAAISQLSDEALFDRYIDVIIELEASRTFHATSGFSNPREYEKFKDLLRYRTYLIMEIRKRGLEVPNINPQ